jgi:prolyl-tRNA editing enzyme YbaK/EbsC (Cys-tRNA(Pro) deacylase)
MAADADAGGSVERVRAALRVAGHPDAIQAFPAGTRSAADAAAAVGCDVAQIAKCVGLTLGRADAAFVRLATGFAIGGVAPVGHVRPVRALLDRDLLPLDPVWAAAGSPSHVFRTTGAALARLAGAGIADIRQD